MAGGLVKAREANAYTEVCAYRGALGSFYIDSWYAIIGFRDYSEVTV